jgi:hypothetical protein
MRVEAREHPVDGFLEQLAVFDRLHVVALDAAEHLAEEAQVVDRELERGDLAIGTAEKVEAGGDAERGAEGDESELLKLLTPSLVTLFPDCGA